MTTSLSFAPYLPPPLFWAAVCVSAAIAVVALFLRAPGAWSRALALAAVLFVLSNPSIVREMRSPLDDVVALVLDKSQSMNVDERAAKAADALAAVRKMLAKERGLEVRTATVLTTTTGEDNGTQLFASLNSALADVPPERIAGAIAITDGEVHDAPPTARPPSQAPFSAIIIGNRGERDRKLTVVNAARFAIVGHDAPMTVRVDDFGSTEAGYAALDVRIDGKSFGTRLVPVGRDTSLRVPIAHGGENVIELEARPGPAELTLENNRAVVTVSGVRDRLRVLLVSGEPHAGERVWRSLLKADPAVDLIHFTILRPPDKQDATPIDELSLIAFPTRELFVEKLRSFDLIIFDRYRNYGGVVLPLVYFENIADYVQNGGALLISSGPEFASDQSVYRTPLAAILPAQPTGAIDAEPFRPLVTKDGFSHPVTRALAGANTDTSAPSWGRWFRTIGANKVSGETVMSGPKGSPLLVLDNVGKGRVAELLSDQVWLWARGYEGGGPVAELLRRLAHWLMKEPELEAERLTATIDNGTIAIERRTMSDAAKPVTVTDPSGQTMSVTLRRIEPGIFRGSARASEFGLYRLSDGTLSTVTAAGPLNPKEVADMRATDAILKPVAEATGGGVHWLVDGLPQIRRVGPDESANGDGWIGLRRNGAYRVASVEQEKLLPAWAALILIVGTLLLAWRLEGR